MSGIPAGTGLGGEAPGAGEQDAAPVERAPPPPTARQVRSNFWFLESWDVVVITIVGWALYFDVKRVSVLL